MHTSWRIQDGSLPSGMYEIAQTSDGFLWFLSLPGDIYRFDGVRFVPWRLPAGVPFDTTEQYLCRPCRRALASRGRRLVRLKDGVITSHFELQGRMFQAISEDPDGSLWVATRRDDATSLPRYRACIQVLSERLMGYRFRPSMRYWPTGKAGFWLGGQTALVHWHAGISEMYRKRGGCGQLGTCSPDGTLWVGLSGEGAGQGLRAIEEWCGETVRDPHVRRNARSTSAP